MEAKILTVTRNPTLTSAQWKLRGKPEYPCVVGVLTRPADDTTKETRQSNVYKDNWFDRLAINHLSKKLQEASGSPSSIHLHRIQFTDKFLLFTYLFIFILIHLLLSILCRIH